MPVRFLSRGLLPPASPGPAPRRAVPGFKRGGKVANAFYDAVPGAQDGYGNEDWGGLEQAFAPSEPAWDGMNWTDAWGNTFDPNENFWRSADNTLQMSPDGQWTPLQQAPAAAAAPARVTGHQPITDLGGTRQSPDPYGAMEIAAADPMTTTAQPAERTPPGYALIQRLVEEATTKVDGAWTGFEDYARQELRHQGFVVSEDGTMRPPPDWQGDETTLLESIGTMERAYSDQYVRPLVDEYQAKINDEVAFFDRFAKLRQEKATNEQVAARTAILNSLEPHVRPVAERLMSGEITPEEMDVLRQIADHPISGPGGRASIGKALQAVMDYPLIMFAMPGTNNPAGPTVSDMLSANLADPLYEVITGEKLPENFGGDALRNILSPWTVLGVTAGAGILGRGALSVRQGLAIEVGASVGASAGAELGPEVGVSPLVGGLGAAAIGGLAGLGSLPVADRVGRSIIEQAEDYYRRAAAVEAAAPGTFGFPGTHVARPTVMARMPEGKDPKRWASEATPEDLGKMSLPQLRQVASFLGVRQTGARNAVIDRIRQRQDLLVDTDVQRRLRMGDTGMPPNMARGVSNPEVGAYYTVPRSPEEFSAQIDAAITMAETRKAAYSPDMTLPYELRLTSGYTETELRRLAAGLDPGPPLTTPKGGPLMDTVEFADAIESAQKLKQAWTNAGRALSRAQEALAKADSGAQRGAEADGLLDTETTRLQNAKPNSRTAETSLNKLEAAGYDVADARASLKDYRETNRSDFDAAEEYNEARQSAWEEFVESLEGAEKAAADAVGAVDQEAFDAAVARVNQARTTKTQLENDLTSIFGGDFTPADLTREGRLGTLPEMREVLRRVHVPGYAETQVWRRQNLLSPEDAKARLTRVDEEKKRFHANYLQKLVNNDRQIAELRALKEFMKGSDAPPGTIASHSVQEAARRFAEFQRRQKFFHDHPGGITRAVAAREPFTNLLGPMMLKAHMDLAVDPTSAREAFNGAMAFVRRSLLGKDRKAPFIVYATLADGTRVRAALEQVPASREADRALASVTTWPDVPVEIRPITGAGVRLRGSQIVKMKDLQLEYNADQLVQRGDLVDEVRRIAQHSIDDPTQTAIFPDGVLPEEYRMREALLTVGEPTPIGEVKASAADLQHDADEAWLEFERLVLPMLAPEVDARMSPEFAETMRRGIRIFETLQPPRSGPDREVWLEAFADLHRQFTDVLGGRGLLVPDADLERALGASDPLRKILYMAGRMEPDELYTLYPHSGSYFGPVVRAARDFLAGRVITNPILMGLIRAYNAAKQTNGLLVETHWGHVMTELKRLADAKTPRGLRAPHAMTGSQKQVAALTRAGFDPDPRSAVGIRLANLKKAMHAASRDEVYNDFVDYFASNPAMAARYPDAFRKLDPEMMKVLGHWQEFTDRINKAATVFNTDRVGAILRNRMSLERVTVANRGVLPRGLRDLLEPEKAGVQVRNLVPKETADAEKVLAGDYLDMVGWIAKYMADNGVNLSIRKLLAAPERLAVVQPLAELEALVTERTRKAIMALGEGVTDRDVVSEGTQWRIAGGLGKFPRNMQRQLEETMKILSNDMPLKTLTDFSRSVSMSVLIADASIVGVQGTSWMLHTLFANPTRAGAYFKEMINVISDVGFHGWLKANYDEVSYFIENGLHTGMESVIGGARGDKAPIEIIPGIGKFFTGVNSIQFDRLLLVMKTQAIRMNLQWVQEFRASRHPAVLRTASMLPGMGWLRAAGKDEVQWARFLYGADEQVVQQIIRQVNNNLGGISTQADGVGRLRAAVEQIFAIVPGFFRAQVGVGIALPKIFTNPRSPEGYIALKMLGSELAFGGTLAYFLSTALGGAGKFNFTDPTSADWLAIQHDGSLGGGPGFVPIIPRPSLIRLAARTVAGLAGPSEDGRPADMERAYTTFIQGRMSPVVGGIVDQIKGKDFLGRTYQSNADRVIAAVGGFMPIAWENIVTDVRESYKREGSLSGIDPNETLVNIQLQHIGKSNVPQSPLETLDDFVKGRPMPNPISQERHAALVEAGMFPEGAPWSEQLHYQKWTDVPNYAQDIYREQYPELGALEAERDYYFDRRNEPVETRIDGLIRDVQAYGEAVRLEPQEIGGKRSTQAQDDEALSLGAMPGNEWVERFQERNRMVADNWERTRIQLAQEGLDLDEMTAERIMKLSKKADPADYFFLVDTATAEYASVEIPWVTRQFSGSAGAVYLDVADFAAFDESRQEVLARYPEEVREVVQAQSSKDATEMELRYRQANEVRKQVESESRYRGMSPEAADVIDAMVRTYEQAYTQLRGQLGFELPSGVSLAEVAWSMSLINAVQNNPGRPVSELEDAQVIARVLESSPEYRNALRNFNVIDTLLENPDALMFYPYLMNRVPDHMQQRLPPGLQTQADFWRNLQELTERRP